eukprot:14064028-Ditylum_brightwellii.AAC.1
MTAPTPNTEYKEYVPSPKQVPEHFKVKETTPLPRVEINEPHIIRTSNNDPPQPAPRVIPNSNGSHIIPQCNAAIA